MFDFRYHALSLVAVFLALGIGIVLGSSLGDSVVSQANKDVRSSLRGDLLDARAAAQKASSAVSQRDKFIDASFARIAGGKLRGVHVAIVSDGPLPQSVESDVRGAVKAAGGTVDTVSRFDAQPDVVGIESKLGPRFEGLGVSPDGLRTLGRRIGRALGTGSRLAAALQNDFPDAFKGTYGPAGAIVYYRSSDDRNDQSKTFESALIEGLRGASAPMAGVEETSTNPSQISSYVNAGLSSVDNVDQPAGRIALVLVLGGDEGNYGVKNTADAPLPPPLNAAPNGSTGP
jgi:hypothetical protein